MCCFPIHLSGGTCLAPRRLIASFSSLSLPCYCVQLADNSKRGFPYTHLIVVVPIEGEELHDPLFLQVPSWDPIVTLHHRIRDMLRLACLIGEFFQSDLAILPLPTTPTMTELRKQNLADLRAKAYQDPANLPYSTFAEFFNRFYVQGQQDPCVHCLVWLPPKDREFL
jgi:hypothetical protein